MVFSLVLDQGNSFSKVGVFEDDQLIFQDTSKDLQRLGTIISEFEIPDHQL